MLIESTISDHLLVIEKIQKEDKWIPHCLNCYSKSFKHLHSLLSCHKKAVLSNCNWRKIDVL